MKRLTLIIFILLSIGLNAEVIFDRVADIVVEGNNSASAEYIISKSELSVGQQVTTRDVQNAIRNLYATTMFRNISIEKEVTGIGEILVINLEEFPRIGKLIIKGNKKKKEKDINEALTVGEGSFASDYNLIKLRKEVMDYYKENGFLNAQIADSIYAGAEGTNVLLQIEEGEVVRIKHIEIFGNYKVTDKKVLSVMQTKQKGFLEDGLFNEDNFEADKISIIQVIKENGFPDAVLDSVQTEFSYDNKWMFIKIYVTQGQQFVFGDMTAEGNENVSDDIISRFLRVEKGSVYNKAKIDNIMAALYEYYMDLGYIYVTIAPEDSREDSVINYSFKITEHDPARVRFVNIYGNEKTEDAVLRREILASPGELFKRSDLVISHNNLYRSGYLENIEINPVPVEQFGDVDIDFTVKEKQSGEFNVAVNYNQVDSFSGSIKIGINNLLGKGLSTSLTLEKGYSVTNFDFSFTEPYVMGKPISAGANLYWVTRDRTYYYDERMGGKVTAGYTLSKKLSTRLYLGYKLERVHVYSDVDTSALDPWIQEQLGPARWLSEISPSIVRDSRSHYFFPESGQLMGLYFNVAGGPLMGEIDYWKVQTDLRFYQKLFWKLVFMGRFAAGFVDGYSDPNTVPLTERFVLGGTGTWGIRGYYERGIGPVVGGYVVGGRGALLANAELRMKLNDQAYLLMFYDIGNSWENMTEARNDNFLPLYSGAGIGVRLEIPMLGILGIDFGYGFTETNYSGGGKWEPHFQMGTSL